MKPTSPVDEPALPEEMEERALAEGAAPTSDDVPPPAEPAERRAEPTSAVTPPAPRLSARFGSPPRRPLLMGLAASVLMVIGGFGAGGLLVHDPILTNSPLGFWRYGHGSDLASYLIYGGVLLMLWAWIRLGRDVLAGRVGGRGVFTVAVAWTAPLLLAPPLFTRDVFSYLAQGALPLAGFDPYAVGPEVLPGVFSDNVHYFWMDTPAPYGPLFILVAKIVAAVSGDNIILGVILMRLAQLPGWVLFAWALPELTRRLGGRTPVAIWIAIANPLMVIHMVGGGHNDLLSVGLLAAGALVALRGAHAGGIALVTLAMAVKASAGVALPFMVLIWAAHFTGTRMARIVKATASGVGVFLVVFTASSVAAGVGLGWLPALSAPSMIVNWMSLPTAVGMLSHGLVSLVVTVPQAPFVNVTRGIGFALLAYFAGKQWWAARDGGPDAVRRAGLVLIAVAVLSPATLPWYVSWGMALLAAAPWTLRGIKITIFLSVMLTISYYSHGEDALSDPGYLLAWAVVAVIAVVSLERPDPLRLSAGAWQRARATPVEVAPVPVAAAAASAAPTSAGAESRPG